MVKDCHSCKEGVQVEGLLGNTPPIFNPCPEHDERHNLVEDCGSCKEVEY